MQTNNTTARWRLFVGLPLDSRTKDSLSTFCNSLRRVTPEARWTKKDQMHITLFFLGDTATERIEEITTALSGIKAQPFEIKIQGTGSFERAGIFFASVEPEPSLLKLEANVKQRMLRCDFLSKELTYRPHITLARARHGLRQLLASAAQAEPLRLICKADHFILYRSHLGKGGSQYEALREFPLSAA